MFKKRENYIFPTNINKLGFCKCIISVKSLILKSSHLRKNNSEEYILKKERGGDRKGEAWRHDIANTFHVKT